MSRIKLKNKKIYLFILLALVIFLQGIFLIPPLDRDESRFASASKNMIETFGNDDQKSQCKRLKSDDHIRFLGGRVSEKELDKVRTDPQKSGARFSRRRE